MIPSLAKPPRLRCILTSFRGRAFRVHHPDVWPGRLLVSQPTSKKEGVLSPTRKLSVTDADINNFVNTAFEWMSACRWSVECPTQVQPQRARVRLAECSLTSDWPIHSCQSKKVLSTYGFRTFVPFYYFTTSKQIRRHRHACDHQHCVQV